MYPISDRPIGCFVRCTIVRLRGYDDTDDAVDGTFARRTIVSGWPTTTPTKGAR
jgi:hypothetical protein